VELIRKGTKGCILNHLFEAPSQALKILKESLHMGSSNEGYILKFICQGTKGPSVRNYSSNRSDYLKFSATALKGLISFQQSCLK
jgi:hypothetical protein